MQNLGFRLRRLLPPASAATSCCLRLHLTLRLFHRQIRTPSARLQHTSGAQSQHQQQDQPDLPEPTVRVAQGLVRGRRAVSKQGGSYLSFQGLPYAEPPVGPLRFKPPQPPQPWGGELAALQPPPIPPQRTGKAVRGQEDCLYLNVYTPQIEPDSRLPVMVWIFGGGFAIGSGNPDLYGPDYLVDAGVVLVTLNYRLGVLGFLNVGNADAAGNMGMKDQVAALRWVRENIGAFGGDRDNVTIFGQSSGAASVNYHMFSPMSRGLFHKAIAQSGSALCPWAFRTAARQYAFRLGELLGSRTEDERQLMDRLMAADADTLVKGAESLASITGSLGGINMLFGPSAESAVEGEESFICQDPGGMLVQEQCQQVPYMSGVTTSDGALGYFSRFLKIQNDFEKENIHACLPLEFQINLDKEVVEEMCSSINSFYFQNKPLSRGYINNFVDFATDIAIASGTYLAAKHITASSTQPVFFYEFAFDGNLAYTKHNKIRLACKIPGPHHGDDLGYIFQRPLQDPDLDALSPEVYIRNLMVTMWTNFAKSGNPTPYKTEGTPITWIPMSHANGNYLRIDRKVSMEKQFWNNRMSFCKNKYFDKF